MDSFDDPFFALNARLVNAIRRRDLAACVSALDDGADPNGDVTNVGQSVLYRAADSVFLDGVRLLLNRGANPDGGKLGFLPICKAAEAQSIEILEALLAAGADVNLSGVGGETALHVAARWTNVAAINHLVLNGANVEAVNTYLHTPLHAAATSTTGQTNAVLRVLVSAGANPGFTPPNAPLHYRTPTQHAAFHSKFSILLYFLEVCGEDPRQRTLSGKTLLSTAGDRDTKQLVLSAMTAQTARAGLRIDDVTLATRIPRSMPAGPL